MKRIHFKKNAKESEEKYKKELEEKGEDKMKENFKLYVTSELRIVNDPYFQFLFVWRQLM